MIFKHLVLILVLSYHIQAQVIGQTPCLCSQVLIQSVCSDIPYCQWNSAQSTCGNITISPTMTPSQCYAAGGCMPYLMEDDDACAPFYSCSQLFSSDASLCQQMNPTCTHTGGNYCTSGIQEKCNNIDECSMSSEGYCYEHEGDVGRGYKCGVASSCSNFNDGPTPCPVGPLCAESPTGRCEAQTCQNAYSGQCTFIATGLSPSERRVEACVLTTGTERTCISASNTSLLNTPALCNTNTNYTYTWNSTDASNGSCVRCGYLNGVLIVSVIAIILI